MFKVNRVYLARHRVKGKIRYVIRESYLRDAESRSRDLFDLGTDPSKHIVYPGGNAFYIDEGVEERLLALGVQPRSQELEDIFWPFVDPDIKRTIETFRTRSERLKKAPKLDHAQEANIWEAVHIFDKRRMHFLRFGQMDQGYIGRMPAVILKGLVGKSRDEIEQYFLVQEQSLKPAELKNYVYVIFDLQRFFKQGIAKKLPQGLDQNKVDRHFLEEICRLNQNPVFWGGQQQRDKLHEYLVRYIIMFFDNDFGYSTFLDDYVKDFINRHRFYKPAESKKTVRVDEASTVFGIKPETLKTINKRGLTRLYRRIARKLHPDTGGKHEQFIKLTEAYQTLIKTIKDGN